MYTETIQNTHTGKIYYNQVQPFETVQDFLGYDCTQVYRFNAYCEWPVSRAELINPPANTFYYTPSALGYGVHDDSTHVERSNVRMFAKKFAGHPGWKTKEYSPGRQICIDITCSDHAIMQTLICLADYPAINDTDCYKMAEEMEQEAWLLWMEKEFQQALLKKFKADHCSTSSRILWSVYSQLKEQTRTSPQIQRGGQVYMDLTNLLQPLQEVSGELSLEWW